MIDLTNLNEHAKPKSNTSIKVRSPKHRRYLIGYDPSQPQQEKDDNITSAIVYDLFDNNKVVCTMKSKRKNFEELVEYLTKYYKERTVIYPETKQS